MRKYFKIIIVFLLFLASFLGTKLTLSYLQDSEVLNNKITLTEVDIRLNEPSWPGNDDDKTRKYISGVTLPKDPQVENIGSEDAVVFIKVEIPIIIGTRVADDGTIITNDPIAQNLNLLDNEMIAFEVNDFNDTNFTTVISEVNRDTNTFNIIAAYKRKLSKGATTEPLFTKIKVPLLVENSWLANNSPKLNISAYAVQADNIMKNGRIIDTSGEISADDLDYILRVYANQARVVSGD